MALGSRRSSAGYTETGIVGKSHLDIITTTLLLYYIIRISYYSSITIVSFSENTNLTRYLVRQLQNTAKTARLERFIVDIYQQE